MCGGWVSTPKHSIACCCRLSGSWVASRVQGHLSRVNEDCHPLVTVLWQSPANRRPSPPPPPLAMGRGPASQHLPCFLPRHTALLPNSSISPSLCGSGALPGLPLASGTELFVRALCSGSAWVCPWWLHALLFQRTLAAVPSRRRSADAGPSSRECGGVVERPKSTYSATCW